MYKRLVAGAILLGLAICQAHAVPLISTTSSATAYGESWRSRDVVDIDAGAGTVARVFDGDIFDASENIDAFHVLADGSYVLSTTTDAAIGGTPYLDGDLILWDPLTGSHNLFFSESLFGGDNEDIDAVHVFRDGRIAMSTTSNATLGGLTWGSDDVVIYDLISDLAEVIFDGGATFDDRENVDALHVRGDGSLIISTSTDAAIGGVEYLDGDLILYDPISSFHGLFFSESVFASTGEDINAVWAVSEPSTLALMAFALFATGFPRRFKRYRPAGWLYA